MSFLQTRAWLLATLALASVGCDPSPSAPDAPLDAGLDAFAPIDDAGLPDAGPAACLGGSVCSLVPDEGCSGSTRCAYAYAGSRTNECVAPGTFGLGEVCADNAQCTAGLSCLGGHCIELCCPGAPTDTCGTGTTCSAVDINVGGGATDPVGVCTCNRAGPACPAGHYCDLVTAEGTGGLCLAQGSCNRLTQDCPGGDGCYGTVRECAPAGAVAENGVCTLHSDCVPGLWCRAVAGSDSLCTAYCEVGSDTCPVGTACTSFGDDEPTVGGCYPAV